ncbi:aspartic proteinase 36 isoform X1 [Syzygium oleosum]|uniref:aspartic proteinase 36 isoform X1 n=1 Tax=Syzygium oleosum TaxID=219896 RepID=UPI0024BB7B27|nr:aspartic proteinase 36 isoform X1 [Syzygium oleosum]
MAASSAGAWALIALAVLPSAAAAAIPGGFPAALTLERAFPPAHSVGLGRLRDRDRARHRGMLRTFDGVVDFPVGGNSDPSLLGLYYARIQLGTPPREFYVQIDTGSDLLWVSCSSCNGCPRTNALNMPLHVFDPGSSSSASAISCSDERCGPGVQTPDSVCPTQSNLCSYSLAYEDGSRASGYYVTDLLTFDMIEGSTAVNSSAAVMFGCSTSQTGDLQESEKTIDGIFGLGQQETSVVSQLALLGVAPRAFSHCLRGDGDGGGTLVLGEILDPNVVYTPLVPSQPYYNLNLQSISMNGQPLSIDPSVFATFSDRGTIVDTGTTLAYLVEEAYDTLINAIANSVSQTARMLMNEGNHCFLTTSDVVDTFPQVSFDFEGGASMILSPQEYLVQQNSFDGATFWCMGLTKAQGQARTILGDIVLRNKIVVYDLAGQRLGWTNYDCSLSVNVSTTTTNGKDQGEYFHVGQTSRGSGSDRVAPFEFIQWGLRVCFITVSLLGSIIRLC